MTKHMLTDQEQAQAERVEAMRLYREQLVATEAANRAAAAVKPEPSDEPAKPSGLPDYARVKVRGTKNDSENEEILQAFERGVRADAAVNGGLVPPKASFKFEDRTVVRLTGDAPPPAASDTETELNGLIAECRYLMREIAFNSARLTYDADDRIRFLSSAQGLALTASKIGKTVAQLRGAGREPGMVETHRHEMVYTHVATTSPLPPSDADSAKQ